MHMSKAKKTPLILTPEEESKVRECLATLQEAQGLVDRAAAALCSVRGFADEWSGLGTPYEVIKRHWHVVEQRRQCIKEGRVNIEQ